LLAALLLSPHAFAQSPPQGFNSTGDVAPFGAHGATLMDIYNDGTHPPGVGVGMGTQLPATTLDVAGPIKPGFNTAISGGSAVTKGNQCAPEGAIAYVYNNQALVVCTGSSHAASALTWTPALGSGGSFGQWQQDAMNTVYQASTDGIVIAHTMGSGLYGFTGPQNPPQSVPGNIRGAQGDGNLDQMLESEVTMPVRKGDYWTVYPYTGGKYSPYGPNGNWPLQDFVYWIPIGN
jgi:hypothetical protein